MLLVKMKYIYDHKELMKIRAHENNYLSNYGVFKCPLHVLFLSVRILTTQNIQTPINIQLFKYIVKFILELCVHDKLIQSCPTLCNPVDCSPPGSSLHEILQAKILERIAKPSSRGSSNPGIEPTSHVSCIVNQVLYHQHHLGSSYLSCAFI